MVNDNVIVNNCETCGKGGANNKILNFDMLYDIDVCVDCFNDLFSEVATEGKEYFTEWAVAMYGDLDRVNALVKAIYGEEEVGIDKEETMMMFTYGILKHPYNLEREGALTIVENCTMEGHKMHLYNNSFPITRKTGNSNDIVYGTLFEIPKYVVLTSYDYTEGYVPRRPQEENMYNREIVEVTTPSGEVVKAEMYYANQNMFGMHFNNYTLINSGNFDDKFETKSYQMLINKNKNKNKNKKGKK